MVYGNGFPPSESDDAHMPLSDRFLTESDRAWLDAISAAEADYDLIEDKSGDTQEETPKPTPKHEPLDGESWNPFNK
ncbi:hypothetical protein ACQ4M4_11360 [Leptolyngbya sp. AN02str]|uniref:hypothetical protein n=1 Tax=Leptolyngbya sp. AN02str TaxID=3423363 RepID=UPI003D3155A8